MGVAHWPLSGRKVLLVVAEGESSIDGLIRVGALAKDKEHFLVDLRDVSPAFTVQGFGAHTQDPSDTDSTRGACGEVAGVGLGAASPFCLGCPIKLYRLLCELLTRGRLLCGTGGASFFPLRLGRLLIDLDFCDESVVGGDDRSSHELSVEEDLLT